MIRPILVTYASRSGFTAGVAEAIGRTLADGGLLIEVRPMSAVGDVGGYQAVVAGSAIRDRQWLPEAMRFVTTQRQALAQRPFAAFLVCITLSMTNGERYRAGVSEWLDPLRALVRPVSEGLFAGGLDFRKLPLNGSTLMMHVPVMMGLWKAGDHRDWGAIQAWAEQTRPLLAGR